MQIVITGSIAYDYLMRFPGHFKEHFIADALDHISLSFLVGRYDQTLGRRRCQYRLHHGEVRYKAQVDGHSGPRFWRLPALAGRQRR